MANHLEIAYAFPNVVGFASSSTNDSSLSYQNYLDLSRFKNAWDFVQCSGSIEVAVLDSGIDFNHPDFGGSGSAYNINITDAYDFVEDEPLTTSFVDSLKHGTRVSGIISARANNAIGIAGCSYNAVILPIRVLDANDSCSVLDLAEALNYLCGLTDKPGVVNMSLGFAADDWHDFIGGIAYYLLCQGSINELAEDYNVILVAAAGNNGGTTNAIEYPAALTYVISVASS